MTTSEQLVKAVAREVEVSSSYPALIVSTCSPDGAVPRLDVHLLEVPSEHSFDAIGRVAEHLDDRGLGCPFLVFAHSLEASREVRTRFHGRGVEVAPRCLDTVALPLVQDFLVALQKADPEEPGRAGS